MVTSLTQLPAFLFYTSAIDSRNIFIRKSLIFLPLHNDTMKNGIHIKDIFVTWPGNCK